MAQSTHCHKSIDRGDSSHFITELVFEDPEATSVENVKHSLSEKEGIPSRQRRLTFPLSSSKSEESIRYTSFADQIRNELHLWQAIVYTNGKALGRLVQPSFTFSTPQESIQSYEFAFDTFYYAKKVPGENSDSTALCFPIDTTFVTSDYTIQLFGRCGSASFALPFRYRVSGREAATKVSLQQQKREYIEKHEKVRRKKENKDAGVIPVQDIAISCGSGFESCLAVFSLRESPATLRSFVLSFIVLTPPPPPTLSADLHKKTSPENKEDMEAVLHSSAANATEPKTKDFNTCKENSMGKVNVNRGKKPKKKTKKVIKNGPGGGSGSYDRLGSIPHSHDYTAVPSNRTSSNRTGSENLPDQNHQMNVVDKILQSINLKDSPRLPDGETSRDLSSPENGGHLSPTRTESESGGPPDPDARRAGDDIKKQKDLTFAFNDFEVEDVYIRRNRSVGSLVRSGSGVLPATSGVDVMTATPSAAPPTTQTTEHLTPNKPAEKQGWRYAHRLPSSPATSPHRLNFRSANGLLQSNGDGRNAVEDTSAVMPPANGQTRFASAIYPSTTAGDLVEHHPPGSDMEQGHQRATFQALLQMGPAHQPMTNLTHQMAAHVVHQANMGSLQMPVVGHPPPTMPHLFAMAPPQQALQGHHLTLGNAPTLASLYGLQLGALLSQDAQLRGVAPDALRREEFRKHKDDIHENTACFYMKPTNDLDRFLTEVTPMLQLDPSMEPQKALDQLTLEDVWKFYYDCSMLGKEIPLHGSAAGKENHCGPCTAHYLPYLSGIQIFTPEDIPHVRDSIFLCDVDGWPSFMRMQYEQFEVNPPWFRLPLYDMMDELSIHAPVVKELKLKDLHPASWFCVAWYPLYRIPDAPLGTRFLTFHNFHPMLHSVTAVGQGGKVPLAVYGLEWYNMLDELWLDNIKVAKPIRSPSPSKPNDNGRYEGMSGGGEVYSPEQQHWMLRIKELRQTAKTFARGLTFRRSTPHGIADANTHHHDFEYFYERN